MACSLDGNSDPLWSIWGGDCCSPDIGPLQRAPFRHQVVVLVHLGTFSRTISRVQRVPHAMRPANHWLNGFTLCNYWLWLRDVCAVCTLMLCDWIRLVPLISLWIEGQAYPGVRQCVHLTCHCSTRCHGLRTGSKLKVCLDWHWPLDIGWCPPCVT